MNYEVVFSSKAIAELEKSFDWYEERLTGLGEHFVNDIDKAISLILLNPEAYPVKKEPYHEKVVEDFPYLIAYEFIKKENLIYVLHVFHTSRNPKRKYKT